MPFTDPPRRSPAPHDDGCRGEASGRPERPLGSRLRADLERRRTRHRRRGRTYRLAFALAAVLVTGAGIALMPLPGPGTLVAAVGVAMLALEFTWAERLLHRLVDALDAAARRPRYGAAVVFAGVVAAALSLTLIFAGGLS